MLASKKREAAFKRLVISLSDVLFLFSSVCSFVATYTLCFPKLEKWACLMVRLRLIPANLG